MKLQCSNKWQKKEEKKTSVIQNSTQEYHMFMTNWKIITEEQTRFREAAASELNYKTERTQLQGTALNELGRK